MFCVINFFCYISWFQKKKKYFAYTIFTAYKLKLTTVVRTTCSLTIGRVD